MLDNTTRTAAHKRSKVMRADRRTFLTAAMATGAAATLVAVQPTQATAALPAVPTREELHKMINDLTTRVVALEGGAPPYAPAMGATTGSISEWPALETAVGTLLARRSFESGFVADFRASRAFPDVAAGRWSWWSFKINGDDRGFTSGAWDARIVSLLATIPAGHRTTIIMQHEPENDSGIVAADWRAAQARLGTLVAAAGRPELDVSFVLMDWTFNPQSGRLPQDWYDSAMSNAGVKVCGLDPYQPYGFLGGTQWVDWAAQAAHFTPVVKAWGCTMALTEYACAEFPGQPDRKANWYRDVYDWAVTNKVSALHTFNYAAGFGLRADHVITSSENSRVEYARESALAA